MKYVICIFSNKILKFEFLALLLFKLKMAVYLIKSPQSGVTLCFQFISAASAASTAAKTFPSHVKTVWAKLLIFDTKNIWVWGNVLGDLCMTLTQGHGCGIFAKPLYYPNTWPWLLMICIWIYQLNWLVFFLLDSGLNRSAPDTFHKLIWDCISFIR